MEESKGMKAAKDVAEVIVVVEAVVVAVEFVDVA